MPSIEPKNLIKSLGTYWSTYYKDSAWFNGLMTGQSALQRQAEQNLAELELSAFRKYILIYHTELVWSIVLRPENKNKTNAAIPQFGISDEVFLSPPITDAVPRCGMPVITDNWFDIGLPNLIDIERIVDHPLNPTLVLERGTDYEIRNGAVVFEKNYLEDRDSFQLFAINAKQDFSWIYKHFGILVHLKAEESSVVYREIVDSLFNCYVGGCSVLDVLSLLAAVTGNAVSKEDETVLDVADGVVITDKNRYGLTERTPCVSKGDTLRAGDSLTTSFTPVYINTLDHNDSLPGAVLGKNQLKHYYRGELCFFNREEKLFTKHGLKQFYLGGWPGDAHEFWKTFHQSCREKNISGNTVLSALAYKGTINPYRFFTDEIGRYHYTLLKIKQESRPTSLNIDDIRIRTLLPPWSSFIIHIDMALENQLTLHADENDSVGTVESALFEQRFNIGQHIKTKIYCHLL